MIGVRKCWYVVADAARAVAYARRRGRAGYDEVARWDSPEALKRGRELVTDRPGRAFDSLGGQRHAMEPPSDPKLQAKRAFAGVIAEAVNAAHAAKQFEALVLFAPARTLGEIRRHLTEAAAEAIAHAADKDVTKMPEADLFAAFDAVVKPAWARPAKARIATTH